MRSFIIIGQTALATDQFSLEDLAGSSRRLDVLLRCTRAALMVSHGVRRDTRVYLVLRGAGGPRVLKITGGSAKFLRPDERSLAILLQKTLAVPSGASFQEVRPGLHTANGDLEVVLADVGDAPGFVLHEAGRDLRLEPFPSEDATFFVGDHLGFAEETLALLEKSGYPRLCVGPVSLHGDDAITVVSNELDRRAANR